MPELCAICGGGLKEELREPLKSVALLFGILEPFDSGGEVIELGYFRNTDIIEPNLDLQAGRAKDVCLGLVKMGYRAPRAPKLWAMGDSVSAAFNRWVRASASRPRRK